jgi:hypothetical protein
VDEHRQTNEINFSLKDLPANFENRTNRSQIQSNYHNGFETRGRLPLTKFKRGKKKEKPKEKSTSVWSGTHAFFPKVFAQFFRVQIEIEGFSASLPRHCYAVALYLRRQ